MCGYARLCFSFLSNLCFCVLIDECRPKPYDKVFCAAVWPKPPVLDPQLLSCKILFNLMPLNSPSLLSCSGTCIAFFCIGFSVAQSSGKQVQKHSVSISSAIVSLFGFQRIKSVRTGPRVVADLHPKVWLVLGSLPFFFGPSSVSGIYRLQPLH